MEKSIILLLKRTGLTLIFLIVVTGWVVNAQIVITTPYEFAVGFSGGTTLSSVGFTPSVPQKSLTGFTAGLTGRINMGKSVGLQLELNYAQQGWKENFDDLEDENGVAGTFSHYQYSRLLNYIQLPLYTRIRFGGKKVVSFIHLGPQIGYMIGESTKENLNGAQPGRVNAQHEMPVQKRFEWGLSGGGGIEIRTGIGYFILEGRYLYSLGDIYKTRREDFFSKASGQTITIKLSYLMPIK